MRAGTGATCLRPSSIIYCVSVTHTHSAATGTQMSALAQWLQHVRTELQPMVVHPDPLSNLISGSSVASQIASLVQCAAHLGRPAAVDEEAQVGEWASWVSTELSPLRDDKLMQVNNHLSSRTYLVGQHLTMADLLVCGAVYPAVASLPTAQILHFCNLIRWCDMIQHTTVASSFFPTLEFSRPAFVQPAAAAVPPPAAPKAAAVAGAALSNSAVAAVETSQAKKQPAGPSVTVAAATAPATTGAAAAVPVSPASSNALTPAADKQLQVAAVEKSETKKEKKAPAAKAAPAKVEERAPCIDMLELCVGRITSVCKHPNAETLYLEEIDVGEEKPRQVISGLVQFVPMEAMLGRRVVVVLNLKPAKMRDVMSYGMVLCASNETHDAVEPLAVPEGVPVGERIRVEGCEQPPQAEINPKKKILEALFPDMRTNAEGVAMYKGAPFLTSQGALKSKLASAWVK